MRAKLPCQQTAGARKLAEGHGEVSAHIVLPQVVHRGAIIHSGLVLVLGISVVIRCIPCRRGVAMRGPAAQCPALSRERNRLALSL